MPIVNSPSLVLRGVKFSIYELVRGVRHPVSDYIKTLTAEEKAHIYALFERLADTGQIWDTRKFNNEEDGIWAFKYKKVRIYCFFDEGRIVLLTNGADKKKRKASPDELKRAKDLREAYNEAKGRGGQKK